MKNIAKIAFVGILSMVGFSCSDFMDLNPTDKPSEATFWKTENDFNLALAGIYGKMRSNEYFNEKYGLFDALTDNMCSGHNEGASWDICFGNLDPNMDGYVKDMFKNAYEALARINNFIERANENTTLSSQVKQKMIAEGKFFRAYYHMFLYLLYGDVPVLKEMLTLEKQYVAKTPADEVYKAIITDFDEAIAALPDVVYSENSGHITQGAAKAFKAKLMLQHAYSKGVPNKEEMKEIVSLLEEIKGYTLQPEYGDLFEDSKQESSPEIMFSVKNLTPSCGSKYDMYMTNWLMYCPFRNLVDEFELKGSGEWKGSAQAAAVDETVLNGNDVALAEVERAKLFVERDKRLKATIFHSMKPFPELRYIAGETDFTGFGCYKYLQKSLHLAANDLLDGDLSPQDMIHMRYGYVLLMIAEAENEANGPTAKVYSAINTIRNRAGQGPLPDGLSQEEMRKKIRHEWRVETAMEGLRYFEMKRWHTLSDIENISDPKYVDYKPKFQEKFYLWPLPQSEIDKSNGVLVQNPDYK